MDNPDIDNEIKKLEVLPVKNFQKIWEYGNEEEGFISFFRPLPQEGFFCFGDIAERDSITVPSNPVPSFKPTNSNYIFFLPPLNYQLLWTDSICSIWRPIPPENYYAIGNVIQRGLVPPGLGSVLCVHYCLLTGGEIGYEDDGSCLWPNLKSDFQAELSLSIWRIKAKSIELGVWDPAVESKGFDTNYFVISTDYSRPSQEGYLMKNPWYELPLELTESKLPIIEVDPSKSNTNLRSSLSGLGDVIKNEQQISPLRPINFLEEESDAASINRNQVFFDNSTIEATVVEFLPTRVSKEQASEFFSKWLSNLWFAPPEIRSRKLNLDEISVKYLPHYIYRTKVRAILTSEVNKAQNWEKFECKNLSNHEDVFFPCFIDSEIEELLIRIGDWKLSDSHTSNNEFDDSFLFNCPPSFVWQRCTEVIDRQIKANAQEILQIQIGRTTPYRNLAVKTEYLKTRYRIVFFPVYIIPFYYQNNTYKFIVNAQTGSYDGTRPYGNSITNTFQSFTQWWSKKTNRQPSLFIGAELNQQNSSPVPFDPNLFYLIFPPSNKSFLGIYEVGRIGLANESDQPITFCALNRIDNRRTKAFTITQDMGQIIFPYKGDWAIEILGGNPKKLIIKINTTVGGKDCTDLLGMVS